MSEKISKLFEKENEEFEKHKPKTLNIGDGKLEMCELPNSAIVFPAMKRNGKIVVRDEDMDCIPLKEGSIKIANEHGKYTKKQIDKMRIQEEWNIEDEIPEEANKQIIKFVGDKKVFFNPEKKQNLQANVYMNKGLTNRSKNNGLKFKVLIGVSILCGIVFFLLAFL